MKWLGVLLAGMVLIGIGAAYWMQTQKGDARIVEVSSCDVNTTSCKAELGDGQWIQLDISDKPIKVMKPLKVMLNVSSEAIQAQEVEFNGVNMDMGFTRFFFKPEENGYMASAMLPICTLSKMDWQAQTNIKINDQPVLVNYYFSTER